MLGDNPEKSKNPLKKAMRRRNAKTVAFAEPTYYEPSDREYSSDEENEGQLDFLTTASAARPDNQLASQNQNDIAVVEPLSIRSNAKDTNGLDNSREGSTASERITTPEPHEDNPKTSTDTYDSQGEFG